MMFGPSNAVRPPSRAMDDPEDFDHPVPDTVDDDEWRARDDQFAGPIKAARTADIRSRAELLGKFEDAAGHLPCGPRVIGCDIFSDMDDFTAGAVEPFDIHARLLAMDFRLGCRALVRASPR